MNYLPKLIHRRPQLWRELEVALLVCGVLCFAYCAVIHLEVDASSRKAANLDRGGPTALQAAGSGRYGTQEAASDILGRVSIPELSLSAPITNDINRIELIRGVGHIPGTALAGGLGTMGLAGHRDTFFRALRRIKPGMHIFVMDRAGTYEYDVESAKVVEPSAVEVLEIQAKPKLVLVTCYPFTFVGAAPQRYIVTAVLRSVSGDAH